MRPVVTLTDGVVAFIVRLSRGLSVTIVIQVDPRNLVLDGRPRRSRSQCEWAILREKRGGPL